MALRAWSECICASRSRASSDLSSCTASDDLFETLKTSLLERVNDKESNVRVQAIVALAKLQQAAGEDEDAADEEDEVNETLVWMLRNDSSA